MGSTLALLFLGGVVWMSNPEGSEKQPPPMSMGQGQPAKSETPKTEPHSQEPLSDAERIARLQRGVESNTRSLKNLQKQLDDPKSEYRLAEEEFEKLDAELSNLKSKIKRLQDSDPRGELKETEARLKAQETNWEKARDRFNLMIQERRVLQEQAAALQQLIAEDRETLARMTGPEQPNPRPAGTNPPTVGTSPGTPSNPAPANPGNANGTNPASPNGQASAKQPGAEPGTAHPPGTTGTAEQPLKPLLGGKKAPSKELIEAKNEVLAKEAAAQDAKGKAESVEARLKALRKTIDLQRKLLETAQIKADQALDLEQGLACEIEEKRDENPEVVKALWAKLTEAQQRYRAAHRDAREAARQLSDLQAALTDLQAEEIATAQDLKQKETEAQSAQKKVADLENPFTLRNIWLWMIDRGPKLLLIALGIYLLHTLVGLFARRIVNVVAMSSTRGTEIDRENRAQTLVGVFRNAAYFLILGGGVVMLLDVAGIPVIPLMGGAAVLGLAVAFGAQNLIRDYFSGFMVLMEDQYGINDVVRIGSISGMVEKITLRVTVLRDLEGIVHFIPHGTITTVSNMTHGWSRALLEIRVAYKEDVDRVMRILVDIGQELRRDSKFGPLITADPEMLGVDAFGESAVMIKFFIKTRPLQQWTVKREMHRRIKKRFDELGIEIPFPHQTVFHRYDDEVVLESHDHGSGQGEGGSKRGAA